jgi:ATP-binding cassette subfamily C protein
MEAYFDTYKAYGIMQQWDTGKRNNIQDEQCFYLLTEGVLTLFFKDRTPDNQDSRPRHYNEYKAPALIPIPKSDKSKFLQIRVTRKSKLIKLDLKSINSLNYKLKESLINLLEQSLNNFPGSLASAKPELSPIAYNFNESISSSYPTDIATPKPNNCAWLQVVEGDYKLCAKTELPDCKIYPITHNIWYRLANAGSYKVLNSDEVTKKFPSFFNEILGFFSLIYTIDTNSVRANAGAAIRQIYTNVESNKGHWNFSNKKLMEIINPIGNANELPEDLDPLMGCLNSIGTHELITFKSPDNPNTNFSQLDNILRASKVRAMKIKLDNKWYNSNNGAFLGFTKDSNAPVAFIPKGSSKYIVIDPSKKNVSVLNKELVENYSEKAYVFFTPFPDDKITGKSMIKFGFQFVKKELLYALLIGSISAIIALFIPIITGYIFDMVIPNSNLNELGQIFFLLLTVAISMGIMNYAQAVTVLRLEGKLNYKLQAAVWDRLLSLKVKFFHTFSSGDLTERSMGVEKIRNVLSGSVLSAAVAFIFSFFYLALLFYFSVKLALVGLALGLIIVIFTVIASYYGFKHVMVIRYLDTVLTGFLFQVVNGINKIRVTNSEERVFSQWMGRYSFQKKHYAAKRKVNVAGEVFGSAFPIFSAIFILVTTHHIIWSGENFTIGNFISFNNAFLCFQGALLQMSMATVPILTIKPIFNMFKPIIEAESEHSRENIDPGNLKGNINIQNLKFKYDDNVRMIIDNLSVKIHQGEYVALVGGSGSGKSTLIRLLLGFEDPIDGQILYDNKNIATIDLQALRSQMGIVLQNGSLMTGSILYNIIGNSTLTEEDAWSAARKAGCAHEIEQLPKKMHTFVKAGEATLSGGQIQRINIARALARKPRVLFFDEATSALDNITQKTITNTLSEMNITRIVIAHRLSTIQKAHRIMVMDKGKIVEQGSYKELLAEKGIFAELVQRQFA